MHYRRVHGGYPPGYENRRKYMWSVGLLSYYFRGQRSLWMTQRYTYRVLQTIQMKLILLWVWAEQAVLGRAKTALKFKYEI